MSSEQHQQAGYSPLIRDPATHLRPAGFVAPQGQICVGDILIKLEEMRVLVAGEDAGLTLQEIDLLVLLALEAGKPVSQNRLALALWQEQTLTDQQKRHLSVLIARLRSKTAGSKVYRVETARKRGYGLMPASTNKIEQIKRDKDGLDVLNDIYRYAATGDEIDPDDCERMKWYGLFHRKQTPGFFMLRLRVPNGVLTSQQIATIGELSNRYGRGQVDITTRQNIQLRWIQIIDVPVIFKALDAAGLEYRQSGMDNIRNITGCPMAGLDPNEVIDASPLTRAIQDATIGSKDYSNLPRKFNISVSGCRQDCATSQMHDLSLTPAIKDGVTGFNVKVGGALGGKSPRYASDLDAFVTPEQAPSFCAAVAALFRDEGPRENRQNSRLKVLIEDWGLERFRRELVARFGPLPGAGESHLSSFGGDHVGVSMQKQPDLRTVGCMVPVGRIDGDGLIEFGRLAGVYGSSELRLTNNQNVLIVNVPTGRLEALLQEPLLARYSPKPSNWLQRTVSCTGRDFCHFALIDTKGKAAEFASSMERLLPLNSPLRVHWSGCQHGCGQHQIGDIGFMATHVRSRNELVEAVDVYVGGRLGDRPRLASLALESVPLDKLAERVADLLRSVPARAKEAAANSN